MIFLLAVGPYLGTLNHSFVFDDVTLISQNPQVINLEWSKILSREGYRPIRTLTYAVNYALGGDDPFGHHLLNLLLHAFNAVLVYRLFWSWTESNILAVSGALFFGLHPTQTAAVAYVSGRKDLLATFFILLGCLAYTVYRKKSRRYQAAASLLFFTLAILSKEVAIVFPALLLLLNSLLDERKSASRGSSYGLWTSLICSLRKAPIFYGVTLILGVAALYYAVYLTQTSRMVGYWGGGVLPTISGHPSSSFPIISSWCSFPIR